MDRLRDDVQEKRGRGRPKKEVIGSEIVSIPENDNKSTERGTVMDGIKYIPYTTQEELPSPILDKKGKFKSAGGYRYIVTTSYTPQGNKYKLIAVYKKINGIVKKLVKVLMPFKKNIRGRNDKAILSELKTAGISGIY